VASPASASSHLSWLRRKDIEVLPKNVYLVPVYKSAIHIIVTLGGRTEERLGLYLKGKSGASAGDSRRRPGSDPHVGRPFLYFGWLFAAFQSPGDLECGRKYGGRVAAVKSAHGPFRPF
jgi:hypothetical protein